MESTEQSPWILEAEEATFQQQVVERSRELLVVVDFWAAWCQPCRLLGPLLEKVARDYDGKFLLVKAETEKLPGIASGFGVESIPAVYAVRDGAIIDFFVGLRDERQICAWVDRLLPTPAETLVAEARALAETDAKQAEAKYREAAELDSNLAAAPIGLAELYLKSGRLDDAQAIVAQLEARGFMEPEAERVKAQVHLAAQAGVGADLDALRRAVAERPADSQAKLSLAEALAGRQQYEEALETALAVVQLHQQDTLDAARVLMVDIFRLLGEDSLLVSDYRRRLSTALY